MSHPNTQLSSYTLTSQSMLPLAAKTGMHAELFNGVEAKLSVWAETNLGLILKDENSVLPLWLNFIHSLPSDCSLFLSRIVPSHLKHWNSRIVWYHQSNTTVLYSINFKVNSFAASAAFTEVQKNLHDLRIPEVAHAFEDRKQCGKNECIH